MARNGFTQSFYKNDKSWSFQQNSSLLRVKGEPKCIPKNVFFCKKYESSFSDLLDESIGSLKLKTNVIIISVDPILGLN